MKKSFLITLAAVSSVALIGCSSSSDDNNDGQGGAATAEATSLNVKAVTAESKYYGTEVLPLKNSKGADLTVKITCEDPANVEKIKVDEAQNLVVVAKDGADAITECTAALEGEGSDGKALALDFTAASNEKAATFEVKEGENAISKIELTKGDASDPKTFNVSAKAAGTITTADGEKTFTYNAGKAFTTYKIEASKDLTEGTAIFTSEANTAFTLDAYKATKTLDQAKIDFKNNDGDALIYTLPVTITVGGDQKPEEGKVSVEIPKDTSKTSAALVATIKGVTGKSKSDITCTKADNAGNITPVVSEVTDDTVLVGIANDTNVNDKAIVNCTINGVTEKQSINFNDVKNAAIDPIKLEDTTASEAKAFNPTITVNSVVKVKASKATVKHYKATDLSNDDTKANELNGITHVVVAKKDLSAKEDANFKLGAANAEDSNVNADAQACTTAQLATGCEFKLKAAAKTNEQGVSNLVFASADTAPDTNKKYVVQITAK